MPTAVGLLFAVERMQWGVKCGVWGVHNNTVIVSNAQSVLSSRSYGGQDGDKRRQNDNVPIFTIVRVFH